MREGTDLMNGDGVVVRIGASALNTGAYVGKSQEPGKHVVQLEDGRIDDFTLDQLTPMLRTFRFDTGALLIVENAREGTLRLHHVRDAEEDRSYREQWNGKFGNWIVGAIALAAQPLTGRETEGKKP